MEEREFLVAGSAPDPYRVTFMLDGTNLSAYCTCPAGLHGQHCKHRFRILRGELIGVVSDNGDQVAEVASWVSGTDLEAALAEMSVAEHEYETAKKRLSAAKKRVARAMRD